MLKDTSLCAIVRDEMMNPAGGISRFLKSTLPHVEEGVVVDTGSIDGTRDVLEDAKKDFPNLRVYDTKFEGYAEARNFSFSKAEKKYALILDADEIIRQEHYLKLSGCLDSEFEMGFNFRFVDVRGEKEASGGGMSTRVLLSKKTKFTNNNYDWKWETASIYGKNISLPIYHFVPSVEGWNAKFNEWYRGKGSVPDVAPSERESFHLWKEFNPKRNNYKASNLDVAEASIELARSA